MKKFFWYIPLLLTLLLSGCTFSLAEDITPPPGEELVPAQVTQSEPSDAQVFPLTPPDPQAGQAIYLEKCAPCHGISGQGDGERANQLPNPVPAFSAPEIALQATPEEWFLIVTKGNLEQFMPPFPSLSDRERWDVVAYSFMLSTSESNLQRGAQLYGEFCLPCHGENGVGNGPQASSLAIQPADFTNQAFMAEKRSTEFYTAITKGVLPYMPEFTQQIQEGDRWVLAQFIRSFSFNRTEATGSSGFPDASTTAVPVPSTPQATDTSAQGFGTIFGNVLNGSGGDVPSDLQITLYGFDASEHVFTQTAKLKTDGSYAFRDVELVEGRVFAASVDFEGMTYGSEISVVPDKVRTLELPITVYESTSDSSVIKIDRLHIFFELLDENRVRIVELYIMSNASNKTLIPSEPNSPAVRFKLPVGSSNLEFQDGQLGQRFLETPDGFGDLIPVQPGSGNYQVLFAFEMPYNRKLDFVQPVQLPVDAVVILVPEGEIRIKGDNFKDEGIRDIQDTTYHLYNGGSVSPGNDLRLTVSGFPGGSASLITPANRTGLVIGLGVFAIALTVAVLWLYRHTKIEEVVDIEDDIVRASTPTPENIEALMDAIIAVDDLNQAGELPEDAYNKRRAELKRRLKELTDAQ